MPPSFAPTDFFVGTGSEFAPLRIDPVVRDVPSRYSNKAVPSNHEQPAQEAVFWHFRQVARRGGWLPRPRVYRRNPNITLASRGRINNDEMHFGKYNATTTIHYFIAVACFTDVDIQLKNKYSVLMVDVYAEKFSIMKPVWERSRKLIECQCSPCSAFYFRSRHQSLSIHKDSGHTRTSRHAEHLPGVPIGLQLGSINRSSGLKQGLSVSGKGNGKRHIGAGMGSGGLGLSGSGAGSGTSVPGGRCLLGKLSGSCQCGLLSQVPGSASGFPGWKSSGLPLGSRNLMSLGA
jgi:hypothetical protein